MRQSLVFALLLSIGQPSVAMAGETLLQSGQRIITRQTAAVPAVSAAMTLETKRVRADAAGRRALQGQGTLAQSGLRARNKILIGLGIAVAVAAAVIAIDRGVEDSTPSSLGQR